MPNFTGQLRSNEIFGALYNMIISQQVFADNIKGTNSQLVDAARVDGSLYGDTKTYYATDALKSAPWGNDAEATNLLALHRPAAPKVQAIYLDIFRQISLTVDNYLSKRAFATEGAFSEFNSVMKGWMGDTKKIYDATTYNTFIGNAKSATGKQTQTLDLTTGLSGLSGEEKNRVEAELIAQKIADILVEMKDVSRDFNDYGFLRSYADGDIKVVWNSKFVNKIKKIDLPTIFHKEGLVDKFDEYVLPSRYFGKAVTESDIGEGKIIGANGAYDSTKGTLRAAAEFDYNNVHYFPGDALATSGTYVAVVGGLDATQVYIEDATVICKILTKLPPYMSAFEVGTSFFNPKSLTENHYLTFGRNTLEYLKNYPMITVSAV